MNRSTTIVIIIAVIGISLLVGTGVVLLTNPQAEFVYSPQQEAPIAHVTAELQTTAQVVGSPPSPTLAVSTAIPAPTEAQVTPVAAAAATSLAPTTTTEPTSITATRSEGVPSPTPRSIPTASVTPLATEEAVASPTAVPTATPPLAATRIQQVATTEAELRSGQFEALLDYGNGVHSSSRVSFDLSDRQGDPRIRITTTYTNGETIQNSEQILIGARAWQRGGDGRWISGAESEGMWGQLQSLLPQAGSASEPTMTSSASAITLQWYDRSQDADVTLEVDPAAGTPRRLQRVSRGGGPTLTVIYTGWNTPIAISPPVEE